VVVAVVASVSCACTRMRWIRASYGVGKMHQTVITPASLPLPLPPTTCLLLLPADAPYSPASAAAPQPHTPARHLIRATAATADTAAAAAAAAAAQRLSAFPYPYAHSLQGLAPPALFASARVRTPPNMPKNTSLLSLIVWQGTALNAMHPPATGAPEPEKVVYSGQERGFDFVRGSVKSEEQKKPQHSQDNLPSRKVLPRTSKPR
jgi:hypothetical protein